MAEIGIFFSSEERSAPEIVDAAAMAEQAGFRSAWLSDHFHPWNDAQGESPFVWSVLGAAARATESMRWTTAVTCPTVRTHPGIVAHAAATTATLLPGRFRLGVGSGEALNEHIFGDRWPAADVRLEMLEEAVQVIRLLWEGGFKHHHGRHYTLEAARLYSLPAAPPPILVSGFGPKSVRLAARIADGFVSVGPDRGGLERYREHVGRGVSTSGMKVCWGEDRDACVRVTHEQVAAAVPCGPDPEEHIAVIAQIVDAGFDEVHVGHIGPDHDGFVDFYAREILPHFDAHSDKEEP